MNKSEVLEIIELLQEAASTLADIRADLGELFAGSAITENGKCKQRIERGVLSAEVALRSALEPVGEFEV